MTCAMQTDLKYLSIIIFLSSKNILLVDDMRWSASSWWADGYWFYIYAPNNVYGLYIICFFFPPLFLCFVCIYFAFWLKFGLKNDAATSTSKTGGEIRFRVGRTDNGVHFNWHERSKYELFNPEIHEKHTCLSNTQLRSDKNTQNRRPKSESPKGR